MEHMYQILAFALSHEISSVCLLFLKKKRRDITCIVDHQTITLHFITTQPHLFVYIWTKTDFMLLQQISVIVMEPAKSELFTI